ncbi:MAG: hypothetical protein AB1635_16650 [Acidobacteriota bacterium]
MKALLAAALLLLTAGVAAQQPAAPPPKGQMPALGRPTESTDEVPPLDFDAYFIGAWDFEWDVPDGPFGPGGSIVGTTVYRVVGDGRYEAETRAEGPSGLYTVTERIEYRKAAKALVKQVTDSRGYRYTSRATVGGDLGGIYYILYESEPFEVNGARVQVKETLRLLSPYNYRVAITVAAGGGAFANYGNPWWRKQIKQIQE